MNKLRTKYATVIVWAGICAAIILMLLAGSGLEQDGVAGYRTNEAQFFKTGRPDPIESRSLAAGSQAPIPAIQDTVYLFSYFVGNGEDGLHVAWSRDGYRWEALNGGKSLLQPTVGEAKLMRDPCLLRDPDGTFHLVWTTAWEGKTIGYARSKDLRHWSEQNAIPVMAHEPEAINCWAPEVAYDDARGEYVIFWSTTIRGKFPESAGQAEKEYNHRIYCTTTQDFLTFTPTRLLFDPGFNVIDATFLRAGDGRLFLIFKDETVKPVRKHLRLARAAGLEGPFDELSPPFTAEWVEGPSALRIGEEYVVYFDRYRERRYGAARSRDLQSWEDITSLLSFPEGARHGTVIAVPMEVVSGLLHDAQRQANLPALFLFGDSTIKDGCSPVWH